MRPRGAIRKNRQRAGKSTDLLVRLAVGDIEIVETRPKPSGTLRLCDITRLLEGDLPEVEVPIVSLSAQPTTVSPGQTSTLTWSSNHATACAALGSWSGVKASQGSEVVGPFDSNGGSGVIVGGVFNPTGTTVGYTVEAWGSAPATTSTRMIPRVRTTRLARSVTESSGQFVLNITAVPLTFIARPSDYSRLVYR